MGNEKFLGLKRNVITIYFLVGHDFTNILALNSTMMLANGLTSSPRSTIRTEDETLLLNGISGKAPLANTYLKSSACGEGKGSPLLGFDPILNGTYQGEHGNLPHSTSFEELVHFSKATGVLSLNRALSTIQQNVARVEKKNKIPANDNEHDAILKVDRLIENRNDLSKEITTKNHRRSRSDGHCMNSVASSDLRKTFEASKFSSSPSLGNSIALRRVKSLTPSRLLRSRSAKSALTTAVKLGSPDFEVQHSLLTNKLNPTSFLSNNDSLILRTSEQDPAMHQMELPQADEMLSNMRLCALLDMYHSVDENFDFMALTGIPNLSLKEFVSLGKSSLEARGLQTWHKPIVQKLLDNGEGITVEGYSSKNAEVVIFEVPSRSKIVVVFRGSDEDQLKPIRKTKGSKTNVELDRRVNLEVLPDFKQAYFELESEFSTVVDKLTDNNPFAEVVFCGHSFGGALATIASVRYASNRPTMRVSAHVFGCPKVGAVSFRQLANSLSNLRVIRFENRNDPVVDTPLDNNGNWHHVGHSILIGKDNNVSAYRFDRKKPSVTANSIFRKNNERTSTAYCQTLEQCVSEKRWITCFAGEDVGDGVKGTNDENRHVV